MDLADLKNQLLNRDYEPRRVNRFIAYINSELENPKSAVHSNSQDDLYKMFVKYYNAGTTLDGINVILAGKRMALITYHGFMNKVKQNHPDVFFDVQIVRKSDTFNFAKESGSVVYSHQIGSPFGDEPIVGAYCVVKFDNGNESLELLNDRDYKEMQNSSKNSSVWKKWPTEFWRKSVIKRACKIYFTEEVKDLVEIDNDDFGLEDEKADDETKKAILKTHAEATAA